MKVILIKDVQGTGRKGETKDVSDGFGRNFLLPKKLALPATEKNVVSMHVQKQVEEGRVFKKVKHAHDLAKKLKGYKVTVKSKADETGRLYGSISSEKLAQELGNAGYDVAKDHIKLEHPLKTVGNHSVSIKFNSGETIQILVTINKE